MNTIDEILQSLEAVSHLHTRNFSRVVRVEEDENIRNVVKVALEGGEDAISILFHIYSM